MDRLSTLWLSPVSLTELINQRHGWNPEGMKRRKYKINSHILINNKLLFGENWESSRTILPEIRTQRASSPSIPWSPLWQRHAIVKCHCPCLVLLLPDLAEALATCHSPSSWAYFLGGHDSSGKDTHNPSFQGQVSHLQLLLRNSTQCLPQVTSSERIRRWVHNPTVYDLVWKTFWYRITTTTEQSSTNFLRAHLSSKRERKIPRS